MPAAIGDSPLIGSPLPRKRFTREEVESLSNTGFFADQRLELIDGDLIDKMGQNPPHVRAIQRCMEIHHDAWIC